MNISQHTRAEMAVIGAPVTDDALFGIPSPDYNSDDEEDKGKPTGKQPLEATFSNDSCCSNASTGVKLSPSGAGDELEKLHISDDKQFINAADDQLGTPKSDYGSDDEDQRRSSDAKNDITTEEIKHHNDVKPAAGSLSPVAADIRHSPDVTSQGLSVPGEERNRGSFRSSGSRSPLSPLSPIIGVSNELAAVNPVLIEAKKVPTAPQLTKEQKELQRELQFKQKQGQMLEKKPELIKAMDDRKYKMKKEEFKKEEENKQKQSTFSVKMGQQAKKLLELEEQEEKKKLAKSNSNSSSKDEQLDEFKKIHSKIHKNNNLKC